MRVCIIFMGIVYYSISFCQRQLHVKDCNGAQSDRGGVVNFLFNIQQLPVVYDIYMDRASGSLLH